MEFLLFYSKYSDKCALLLNEIPLLADKAVCIDSAEARALLGKLPYPVKRVPTLLVTDGIDKIIKVLEGAQEIRNWFVLVTYSMATPDTVGAATQPLEAAEYIGGDDDMMPPQHTMLSEVIDDEEELGQLRGDQRLKVEKVGDVKSIAETLQRERETFIEITEKPRS
jgi:hypothetical protein